MSTVPPARGVCPTHRPAVVGAVRPPTCRSADAHNAAIAAPPSRPSTHQRDPPTTHQASGVGCSTFGKMYHRPSRRFQTNPSTTNCFQQGHGPVGRRQLVHDRRQMILDGLNRDHEFSRDLGRSLATRQAVQDLKFARGEIGWVSERRSDATTVKHLLNGVGALRQALGNQALAACDSLDRLRDGVRRCVARQDCHRSGMSCTEQRRSMISIAERDPTAPCRRRRRSAGDIGKRVRDIKQHHINPDRRQPRIKWLRWLGILGDLDVPYVRVVPTESVAKQGMRIVNTQSNFTRSPGREALHDIPRVCGTTMPIVWCTAFVCVYRAKGRDVTGAVDTDPRHGT